MTVRVELTEDEALVLFDWICRAKPADVEFLIQTRQAVTVTVES